MSTHATVYPDPAYGKDYHNVDDALTAWRSGKSFILAGPPGTPYLGKPCSVQNIPLMKELIPNLSEIRIRFNRREDHVDLMIPTEETPSL